MVSGFHWESWNTFPMDMGGKLLYRKIWNAIPQSAHSDFSLQHVESGGEMCTFYVYLCILVEFVKTSSYSFPN